MLYYYYFLLVQQKRFFRAAQNLFSRVEAQPIYAKRSAKIRFLRTGSATACGRLSHPHGKIKIKKKIKTIGIRRRWRGSGGMHARGIGSAAPGRRCRWGGTDPAGASAHRARDAIPAASSSSSSSEGATQIRLLPGRRRHSCPPPPRCCRWRRWRGSVRVEVRFAPPPEPPPTRGRAATGLPLSLPPDPRGRAEGVATLPSPRPLSTAPPAARREAVGGGSARH